MLVDAQVQIEMHLHPREDLSNTRILSVMLTFLTLCITILSVHAQERLRMLTVWSF